VGAPAPIQHTADRMRSRKLARNVLTAILADLPEPVVDDVPA
jgi:hypothetical protein